MDYGKSVTREIVIDMVDTGSNLKMKSSYSQETDNAHKHKGS